MIKTNKTLLKYKDTVGDSQKDLAIIADVPYHSVVKFFRDPGGIGANKAIKISRALKMPMEEAKKLWIDTKIIHKSKLWLKEWDREVKLSKTEPQTGVSVSYDCVARFVRNDTIVGARTTVRMNPTDMVKAKELWLASMKRHKESQWSKDWDREIDIIK